MNTDKPVTTAGYINHAKFEEPVPYDHRDKLHVLLAELIFDGYLPELQFLLGPQVELAR